MNFTIKAGCRTADNTSKMILVSGRRLYFRFRLGSSCQYDHESIINSWNRVFGVSTLWPNGTCDLVFTKDHDELILAMQVTYNSVSTNFKTSILKRLVSICPGVWHQCEIIHYKNPSGNWFYNLVIEGENDFFFPVSWQMNAPQGGMPLMFLRHPKLGGRYSLTDDIELELEIIN